MLLGLFTTRDVACDVRHKAGQAASLAATECRALSSEFSDIQGHMKQPENSSAVRMYGRVEKRVQEGEEQVERGKTIWGRGEEHTEACCKVWMNVFGRNLSQAAVTQAIVNLARQAARGYLHCSPIVHSQPVSDSCFLVSISLPQINSSLAHPSDFKHTEKLPLGGER